MAGVRRFGKPQSQFAPGKGDIVTSSLKNSRKNPPGDEKKDPMREKTTPDSNLTIGPDYGVRGGNLDCKGIIAQGIWCSGSLSRDSQLELSEFGHHR